MSEAARLPSVRRKGTGLAVLAVCFLVISVPVETVYSWRHVDAYYWVKVAGWVLLGVGVARLRGSRTAGTAFLIAGWAWMAANFWRAIADRLRVLGAGGALRLGTTEIAFAGACLGVCAVGLVWGLVHANRGA